MSKKDIIIGNYSLIFHLQGASLPADEFVYISYIRKG